METLLIIFGFVFAIRLINFYNADCICENRCKSCKCNKKNS